MTLRLTSTKLAVFGILIIVAIWATTLFSGESSATRAVYKTATTDIGAISRSVSASGSVRPLITVDIGSQLSGKVLAMYADYNDEVEKGALLARIDPQSFETSVKQAKAQLAVANANVAMQKASIERAEAQLEEAERQVKRQQELHKQGNVSESTLDSAVTAYRAASADVSSARAALQNAEATVEQRQAALDQAQIDLDRTEIRSPINGTVIERSVDVGQTVAASLSAPTLYQLAQDLSEIQVEAAVDEADIGSVGAGNRVSFSVDAYPDRTFAGTVKQIRLAPDETSNVVTYTVIITARNEARALLPGMTANVEIFTGEKADVVRIDNSALRFRPSEKARIAEASEPPAQNGPRERMARLAEDLSLTPEQQKKITEAFEAMRPQRPTAEERASGGLTMRPPQRDNRTSDRVQRRQQMMEARAKIMRSVLTEEQWAQFQTLQKAQEDIRFAQVWVLGEAGMLQPVRVALGLSDDNFTEVVTGLKAGTSVVTREERPKG